MRPFNVAVGEQVEKRRKGERKRAGRFGSRVNGRVGEGGGQEGSRQREGRGGERE